MLVSQYMLKSGICVILSWIVTISIQAQAVYYVSTSGDDLQEGTSASTAWRNIQRAADILLPGDKVFIMAGTYTEDVVMANDGAPEAYITYQRFGNDQVILTRDFKITKDYITIRGLELSGSSLWIDGNYDRILDNYIHHSAVCGMFIHGTYNLIRGNRIANNGSLWCNQISTGWGSGDTHHIVFEYNEVSDEEGQGEDLMQYLSHDFVVRGNVFHHLGNNGRHNDVYQSGGGEYNIWMIGNRFEYLNGVQYFQGGDGDYNHIWRGNLFFGNIGWGFNGAPDGMRVINNTFSLTGPSGGENGNWGVGSVGKALNNIFSPAGSDGHGGDVDFNCVNPAPCCSSQGPHDLWNIDPQFINADEFNFHLQNASPCIDAGTYLARTTKAGSGLQIPITDAKIFIDGFGITHGDSIQLEDQAHGVEITQIDYASNIITVSQPLSWESGVGISTTYSGTAPDMGAFEFSPLVSAIDRLVDTVGFKLYPNPTSDVLHVIMDMDKPQRIEIFNYLGSMVRQQTFSHAAVIDITDLPVGVYFVRCDNCGLPVQRFIKC